VTFVAKARRVPIQASSGFDLSCHVGQHELNSFVGRDGLAELLALAGELERLIECALRQTDRATPEQS
jgi:hypothetical protein